MANGNPFSPRFGSVPPVLGDRRDVLAELAEVAEGNLNSPACATLLLGTRGIQRGRPGRQLWWRSPARNL